MTRRWIYDLIYRFGAPWEIGVRSELRELVDSGRLRSEPGHSALDLGCGSGADAISRMAPAIEPGEVEQRFGAGWEVERLIATDQERSAAFLLTRKA